MIGKNGGQFLLSVGTPADTPQMKKSERLAPYHDTLKERKGKKLLIPILLPWETASSLRFMSWEIKMKEKKKVK